MILIGGPRNGTVFRSQKWGRENANSVVAACLWEQKLESSAGTRINLFELQELKMIAWRNAMLDQTRNLFARIPKTWNSNF